MTNTVAMSQDFAAISSATMAALLILVLTELQATANQVREAREALLTEYGAAIRASFDEFFSGTPLAPDQKKRVQRELKRWRNRAETHEANIYWRGFYALAAALCVAGLVVVLRWSALEHPTKGYTTARFALVAMGWSATTLLAGWRARQQATANAHRQQELLKLSALLDVPDAQDAEHLYRLWARSPDGGNVVPPSPRDQSLIRMFFSVFWRSDWKRLR
ncbi:hypothetical protein [Streptomyces carpinensis]|uniref:DUF4231 domain-containing protein n=1 Tax=Streptomyces carpinensis TaxID=66369 RepID=A0ABV1W2C5_9ACTN|nr:hypothetical protein [Streptomyces carpinensis]